MAPVINIQPAEGWGYFTNNRERLAEELVEIAVNEDTNTSVYMTEEDNNPYLYVYRDDKKIFQSVCTTIFETERNLRVIYAKYLTPLRVVISEKSGEEGETDDTHTDGIRVDQNEDDDPVASELDVMSEAEFQEYVDERESVIFSAVSELIEVLTEDDTSALEFEQTEDDCIDNVVNHIVEYLAIECGFRIRRPMVVIDDESGLQVRTEYPYEDFDFSDDELH